MAIYEQLAALSAHESILQRLLLPPIIILLVWVIHTRLLHPLTKVPGPFLASITRLWYVYKVRQGAFDQVNRALHAKYGPLVRIAPDEVSVSDPEAVHQIYAIKGKFTKTDFYPAWAPQGIETKHGNIFTDLDLVHHGERRRLVAHIYSMSGILESEHYIDNCTELFIDRLWGFAEGKKNLDLGTWLQMYAFDVLGELFFGSAFGFLETSSDYGNWIETLDVLVPVLATVAVLPASLRTPYLMTGTMYSSMRRHLERAGALVAEAKARVQKRQEDITHVGTERRDILHKLIQLHKAKGEKEDYQLGDIQMESYVNLLAGSDTTAIAMQTTIFNLLTHLEVYQRLLAELEGALKAGTLTLPVKYADALKLPYFTACVKEAMRLHPSVGLQLPRHPPAPQGCEIAGHYFPPSTRVGINACVLHYDKAIFGEDAEVFNPDRWLGESASYMDRYLLTFGGGVHTCLGKNISLAEIYKMIPHILLLFDLELVEPDKPLKKHDWWFFKLSGLNIRVSKRDPLA